MENQNPLIPIPKKQSNKIIWLVVLVLILVGVLLIIKNKQKDTKNSETNTKISEIQETDANKAISQAPSFLLIEKELKPISAYEFVNPAGDKQIVVKLEASKEVSQDSLVKLYESAIKAQKDWVYINSAKVEGLVAILAEKQDRSQGLKITLLVPEKEKPLEVELLLTFPKNIPQIKK